MRSMYYDKEGKAIEIREWSKLFEHYDYKQVGDTKVKDVRVSTVWLGLDHSFSDTSPVLIFETMVFGGKLDGEMERYSTETEARIGHARMVSRVKPWWKRWGITFAPSGRRPDSSPEG